MQKRTNWMEEKNGELGPDEEDDADDDNDDDGGQDITPSKNKAAQVKTAQEALQKATRARDDAKAALVGPRNQLIEAVIVIPRHPQTAQALAFIAAVHGIGSSPRTRDALQASYEALEDIDGELPQPVQQAKDNLVAAIGQELGSDGAKISAG